MKAKLLTFFLGLVVGVTGTIFVPRLLGPLLPAGLRSGGESVEGTVIHRQRDGERLLLTINTPQGAALATFTEKVAEIDLLVEAGDAVTLGMGTYAPFVDNPLIRAVRKGDHAGTSVAVAGGPAAEPEDSVASPSQAEPPGVVPAGVEPTGEPLDAEAELEEWPGAGTDG